MARILIGDIKGDAGLTTSVNGVEQVGGAISIDLSNIPETNTEKKMTADERTKLNELPTASGLTSIVDNKVDKVAGSSLASTAEKSTWNGKEDVSNKKTSLTDNSDTFYPSQKAVKTAVDAIPPQYGNIFARMLGTKLTAATEPACILLQGDSTGNDSTEWYYQLVQYLCGKYPAYSILHRVWEDATQSYSSFYVPSQVGTNGEAYISLNGTTGNYLSTPHKAAIAITGDIDVCIKCNMTNTGTSGYKALVSKFGTGTGSRGWSFQMRNDTKELYFWWSADGTNLIGPVYSTAAAPIIYGQDIWLRATLDVNDGAGHYVVTFYTSSNGYTWTQLGNPVTGTTTTSIYNNSTVALEVGSRGNGGADVWQGKVYSAIVRSGIGGKVVASPNAGLTFPSGTTTFLDVENNTWTINGTITGANGSPLILSLNASAPGKTLSYSTDSTRFTLQTPIEPQIAMISYGHNETTVTGWQTAYEGLCAQLKTKYPNVGIVGVTQNPQLSPRTTAQILLQSRLQQIIAQTMAKNNYGLIDAFRAFSIRSDIVDLVNADGIHPSQAGSDLWRDVAKMFFAASIN